MSYNNKKFKGNKKKVEDNYCPPYSQEVLSKSIDTLNLPEEISEKLKAAKIDTIFAVLKLDQKALLHVNKFNKKNLFVLEKQLKSNGLAIKPLEELKNSPKQPLFQNQDKSKHNTSNQKPWQNVTDNRSRLKEKGFKETILTEAQEREEKEKSRPKQKPIEEVKDIYLKINKNGKWGFEDRSGNEVIPPEYEEAFNFKEDLCCVMKDEKYGFIDRKGVIVIPFEYDLASSFSEGYACVFRGDKCAYIDKENNLITPFIYDAGTAVENNQSRVKKDDKWGELHMDSPNEVRWII
jgi:hypothetical protein